MLKKSSQKLRTAVPLEAHIRLDPLKIFPKVGDSTLTRLKGNMAKAAVTNVSLFHEENLTGFYRDNVLFHLTEPLELRVPGRFSYGRRTFKLLSVFCSSEPKLKGNTSHTVNPTFIFMKKDMKTEP